jgi:hypothetical protein
LNAAPLPVVVLFVRLHAFETPALSGMLVAPVFRGNGFESPALPPFKVIQGNSSQFKPWNFIF